MKNFAVRLLLAFLFLAPLPALAQSGHRVVADCTTGVPLAYPLGSTSIPTIAPTGAVCVVASVSASISGFPTVQSTGTPISVTTSSATGTLPAGTVVVASNVGTTNGAYCKLGASATVSDQLIPPNSWFAFTVGANTQLSCITSTSTTTVNMVGGSGLPTGSGGGGGGGGAGDASAANQTAVQTPVAPAAASATKGNLLGGTYNSTLPTFTNGQQGGAQFDSRGRLITLDDQVLAAVQAAIPAGTNEIGAVNLRLSSVAMVDDPCKTVTPTSTPISITTATTTRIVAPAASKKTYICYLFLTSAAADNIGIVEGTGGTCGTGAAGVIGGTTAANGPNFAANGGVSIGNGETWVAATAGTNVDLCLITSAATPLAGTIKWVQK